MLFLFWILIFARFFFFSSEFLEDELFETELLFFEPFDDEVLEDELLAGELFDVELLEDELLGAELLGEELLEGDTNENPNRLGLVGFGRNE